MDFLLDFIQTILGMGAVVMLPIVIAILGIIFRMKVGEALKAGLMVGIGFQGLALVIDLLMLSVSPAIEYYQELGEGFTVVDVGWAAMGAASWSVPFAALAIILIVVINLVMILTRVTSVMNVDIWNYIHFLIPGALAYALFGSFWAGLIVTVGLSVITLFVAEKIAPRWEVYYGLDGTTSTTFSFITFAFPVGVLLNKIFDMIPGVRDIEIDLGDFEDKLGFFGDPAIIGLIVGTILGIITRQDITVSLMMGMGVAATLVLIPKMVSVMMEGLSELGNSAQQFMKTRVGEDAKLFVGMDIALALGDPSAVTTSVLLIPISILLAFIIPGMNYFPVGILTVIVYMVPMISLTSKGNLFRTLVGSIIFLTIVQIGANEFAPEATAMMNATGVEVEGMVTDGFFGFNLANIIISLIYRIFF